MASNIGKPIYPSERSKETVRPQREASYIVSLDETKVTEATSEPCPALRELVWTDLAYVLQCQLHVLVTQRTLCSLPKIVELYSEKTRRW